MDNRLNKQEEFKKGMNISCIFYDNTGAIAYRTAGTVIKKIEPFQALTELEMKVYAELNKGDHAYKSIEGARCKVHRVVLETFNGYTIVPLNFNRWVHRKLEGKVNYGN